MDDEAAPPIAIIGIGCRFPGARGPEALWRLVRDRSCSVAEVPEHRAALGYSVDRFYDPRPRIPGRVSSCKAGFVDHPELFDPAPFGLTPRDAAAMEPQARMMLEVVWDAIQDAGLAFDELRGERVAVLVGHTAEDFSRERIAVLGEDAAMRGMDVRTAIGYARAAISGRISHWLDLRGPCLTLDTACSSSLYATHLACQSLWRGESKLALAGGVNLFLTPEGSLALSRSGMMAPDGRCKAFDARADGFVRAEGAGVVLLRPLRDALANRDPIYAVIRGTGVSADGRDGGHMMAPGRSGQALAMHDAYEMARLSPAEIDFVEAHGTGTVIGDPVEIAALGEVMGPGRDPARPLRVSSIKGNIGHAESASGIAGLIRAALAVHHRVLPAQLHFETPNPMIAWDELPIEVQRDNEAWPHEGTARVGVNSFGISGTNAHVILESAPDPDADRSGASADGPFEQSEKSRDAVRLIPLSAHDPGALEDQMRGLLSLLRCKDFDGTDSADDAEGADVARSRPALDDLGYTLANRRTHLSERIAFVAHSPEALALEIEGVLAGEPGGSSMRGRAAAGARTPITFVFPGQGGQWVGMARDLLQRDAVFRGAIEAWDLRFRRHVDWSLVDVLLEEPTQGKGTSSLDRLSVLQPTLVALQIALADWLAHHGVVPDRVIGQSVGEVSAAAVAGILEPDLVALLACRRGAAVERVAGKGAMGIVGLPEDETRDCLEATGGRVEIAGQNGLSSTLIAGDRAPLRELVASLEERGVFARPLEVDFASHCFHLDPVLKDFEREIFGLRPRASAIPFHSSVAGRVIPAEELDARYWVRNLREPVRFADATRSAIECGPTTLAEISPHPTLGRAIEEIAAAQGTRVETVETLKRGLRGEEALQRTLARLHVAGHTVAMKKLYPRGKSLRLPLYPFQKQTLWFAERRRADLRAVLHPLLGSERHDAGTSGVRSFETLLDLDATPTLGFSSPDIEVALPSGLCAEIASAAAAQLGEPWRIAELRMTPETGNAASRTAGTRRDLLQTRVEVDGRTARVRGFLRARSRGGPDHDGPWRPAFEARLEAPKAKAAPTHLVDREALLARLTPFDPGSARTLLASAGASLPRGLDGLRELHASDREWLARIEIPPRCQNEVGHFHLHPVVFENAARLAGALLEPRDGGAIPASVAGLQNFERAGESTWCHAQLRDDDCHIDLDFFDDEGRPIARARALATHAGRSDRSTRSAGYLYEVERACLVADSSRAAPLEPKATPWISLSACADRNRVRPFEDRAAPDRPGAPGEPYAIEVTRASPHARKLIAVAQRAPAPGAGEVSLRVEAAGLGQRDLRAMLGLAASEPGLGRECAGFVTAVGAGVAGFAVGDRVVGIARPALAREVTTRADWLVALPETLPFEQAASLALGYVLAHRALEDLARVKPGERVLLALGGGAIALAAARVAVANGAHVFGAASTAERRSALRACGAATTCDSKHTTLRDALARWTDDGGFDVVLSTAPELTAKSVRDALRSTGRWVDLRAADERSPADSKDLAGNRAVFALDFEAMLDESPETIASLLARAIDSAARDAAASPANEALPVTRFPAHEFERAFRYCAQNRHVGRLVLDFTDSTRAPRRVRQPATSLCSERNHWLSGPTAASIERLARFLAARGARALVVHPTRPLACGQAALRERLEAIGLGVEFAKGDPRRDWLEWTPRAGGFASICHAIAEPPFDPASLEAEIDLMKSLAANARATDDTLLLFTHRADEYFQAEDPNAFDSQREVSQALRAIAGEHAAAQRTAGGNALLLDIAQPLADVPGGERRIQRALGRWFEARIPVDGLVFTLAPDAWPAEVFERNPALGALAVSSSEDGSRATPRDLEALAPEARRQAIHAVVEERVAGVLALSKEARSRLDVATPLVDLGLDSLLGRELTQQIEKEIGLMPSLGVWAQRPGIAALVADLAEQIGASESRSGRRSGSEKERSP